MCVFSSISKSFSPSLSFGVEQGVWLQDEVGSHWKNVGALADSKCVGARETCCLATTAPLSSGCDGDVLHIAYAWVCKVLAPLTFSFVSDALCIRPRVCVCVRVWLSVPSLLICMRVFVRWCVCVCLWERERERESGERRGRKALHHPLSRPSAPMADSPRLC